MPLNVKGKVELSALPRGASAAKPSGTPPKPRDFPSSIARPPQYTATEDGQATAEDGRKLGYVAVTSRHSSPCGSTRHPGEGEWTFASGMKQLFEYCI